MRGANMVHDPRAPLSDVVEMMSDVVVVAGPDDSIVAVSRQAEQLLASASDDLLGRPLSDVLRAGEPVVPPVDGVPIVLRRRDGSTVTSQAAVKELSWPGSRVTMYVVHETAPGPPTTAHGWADGAGPDLAHDFNNLLAVILNYADVMARRLEGDPLAVIAVEPIRQAAERAAKLAHHLVPPQADPAPAHAGHDPGRAAAHGCRVLVVDDSNAVREVTRRMLVDRGYRVDVVASAEAALTAVAGAPEPVDVVVTDNTMPGLSGTELVRRLWATKPRLPVVLMSGDRSLALTDDERRRVVVLAKPFAESTLVEAVRTALEDAR